MDKRVGCRLEVCWYLLLRWTWWRDPRCEDAIENGAREAHLRHDVKGRRHYQKETCGTMVATTTVFTKEYGEIGQGVLDMARPAGHTVPMTAWRTAHFPFPSLSSPPSWESLEASRGFSLSSPAARPARVGGAGSHRRSVDCSCSARLGLLPVVLGADLDLCLQIGILGFLVAATLLLWLVLVVVGWGHVPLDTSQMYL
jgi:hypothetical protein